MFTPLPSYGDNPILFELVYHNLRIRLVNESSGRKKQLTWTVLPAFLFHQVAEF